MVDTKLLLFNIKKVYSSLTWYSFMKGYIYITFMEAVSSVGTKFSATGESTG